MLTGEYDIFRACAVGDIEYVENCLLDGMNPNETSKTGWTPLIVAVENEQKKIAELLLKNGADINFQPNGGWAALHQAVDLSIDGTIQTENSFGNEPIEMIQFLLDNGADINLMTNDGESPLDVAKAYRSQKIIKFLEDAKNII